MSRRPSTLHAKKIKEWWFLMHMHGTATSRKDPSAWRSTLQERCAILYLKKKKCWEVFHIQHQSDAGRILWYSAYHQDGKIRKNIINNQTRRKNCSIRKTYFRRMFAKLLKCGQQERGSLTGAYQRRQGQNQTWHEEISSMVFWEQKTHNHAHKS